MKSQGSAHYKTGGVEPIDLYCAGGMFRHFAICSIIKYAFRLRLRASGSDCDKIIDYAEKLKAFDNQEGDCRATHITDCRATHKEGGENMDGDDMNRKAEIERRSALLIPRVGELLGQMRLRWLYPDEEQEVEAILREIDSLKELANG